jgi:hypothetical protein
MTKLMKRARLVLLMVGLVAAGWFLRQREADPPAEALPAGWTQQTTTDPAEVFRRGLWRQPTADDQILHAERREWSEAQDGVARWQWFLAVAPSAELRTWLRERDPFSLRAVGTFPAQPLRAPSWFPQDFAAADCDIFSSDGLTLVFSRRENRLWATGHGHGLAPAVAHAPR